MRQYAPFILFSMIMAQCSNIGFVDKAKAVANNTFGIETFVAGPTALGGSLLTQATSTLHANCFNDSGITKANCACDSIARERGFSGTFRAWLSISGQVDAICNIQGIVGTNCSAADTLGPFVSRNDGSYKVMATDYAELGTSGSRIALATTSLLIFTGTGTSGRATGSDCGGFVSGGGNGTAGDQSKSGNGFTSSESALNCASFSGTILCMRQTQ